MYLAETMEMTSDINTPTIVLLCGGPASGKSTWVRRALESPSISEKYKVLSTDDWLEKKAKEINKSYVEIFDDYIRDALEYFIENLYSSTKNKDNLIIDQTNIDRISRLKKIRLCDEYNKIGVYFELELSEAITRNCNRDRATPRFALERYYQDYERPQLDEGFDRIINGNENHPHSIF